VAKLAKFHKAQEQMKEMREKLEREIEETTVTLEILMEIQS
jgi:hypothetical protein